MDTKNKNSAPILDMGLDILEYLSISAVPNSQAEIAQGLKRSPNEIDLALVALQTRRYIVRDEISGKYRLSLKLYSLSHPHSPIEQLRQAAQMPMLELAAAVGQSCQLSVPYEDKLMVVSQVKSPNPVSLSISEGTLLSMYETVSGRLLLANYSPDRQTQLLQKNTAFAGLSAAMQSRFLQQLEDIREAGHHYAPSELTVGVTDYAAFVGLAETDFMAAVAVSALTTSLSQTYTTETFVEAVSKAATAINHHIGLIPER